jgi:hypothetical protein
MAFSAFTVEIRSSYNKNKGPLLTKPNYLIAEISDAKISILPGAF